MDPKSLLYSESHEWVEPQGEIVAVGISDHAQHMLGDIVYVEMPEVGRKLRQGDEILTVESPKAAASVYAPVGGEIVEINELLESAPDTINSSPCADGWLVRIRPDNFEADRARLLTHEAYMRKIEEE